MTRPATWLIASLSLALLGGLMLASDHFFTVDEVIYFFGAHAYQTTGSFFIDNGYGTYGSNDLRMWLLRGRPEGLTPQYPPGTAILGGWFMSVLGMKGMMVVNTLAAIATLFATHSLSRRLFDDAPAIIAVALLALCTFWVEYAYAYWPHTISVLLVTLSLLLFLPALDAEKPWPPAFWAGLVIGASLLIRLDGLLILPFFVLASILFAQKPVAVLVGGAIGLLPGLLALAALNAQKFGIFHPLTYGHAHGGGTALKGYAAPLALLAVAFGAMIWLRLRGLPRPTVLLGAAVLLAFVAVLVPAVGAILLKFVRGIDHILIDIHGIPDNREGVVRFDDRTTLFWGLPKKALAQSLPWLGVLAALMVVPWGRHRRNIVLVLLFFALWSLPFVLRSWHGGLGSNMRYLLPTVPALCALAGWLIFTLQQRASQPGRLVGIGIGVVAGLALAFLWPAVARSGQAGVHQVLPLILLSLLVITALAARYTVLPVLTCLGLALGVSSYLGASDLLNAQMRRAMLGNQSAKIATLPPNTVVYDIPETTWPLALGADRMGAIFNVRSGAIDADFVRAALADGNRVLANRDWADRFTTRGFTLAETEFAPMGLVEVLP